MTNKQIAAIGYVVLAIAAGLFLEHGLTAATAVYLWTNPRTHEVSLEIVAELRKVSWPSLAETKAATIAVVLFSLIAAVVLGIFDVAWQWVTDKIQNPTL